jgi:hypothetical protein
MHSALPGAGYDVKFVLLAVCQVKPGLLQSRFVPPLLLPDELLVELEPPLEDPEPLLLLLLLPEPPSSPVPPSSPEPLLEAPELLLVVDPELELLLVDPELLLVDPELLLVDPEPLPPVLPEVPPPDAEPEPVEELPPRDPEEVPEPPLAPELPPVPSGKGEVSVVPQPDEALSAIQAGMATSNHRTRIFESSGESATENRSRSKLLLTPLGGRKRQNRVVRCLYHPGASGTSRENALFFSCGCSRRSNAVRGLGVGVTPTEPTETSARNGVSISVSGRRRLPRGQAGNADSAAAPMSIARTW